MRLKVIKDSSMANFSLRLLASLAVPAVFVAAQDTIGGFTTITPSPDLGSFPTAGPTVPSRNATFFPGPRTTSRPPYMNTSRPIHRPTLTRPDPGATITSWTTEIVTVTSCPCAPQPDYGYEHETTELCTSSRTLTVTLTSTIKGCHNGYGVCKDTPGYPDYPEPTQEPPHHGEGDEGEEIGCNEGGEYGGDEDLGECYGREEGCGNYEYSQDDAGDRYEDDEDGYGESYDESKQKQGHWKEKDGSDRKENNAYSDPDHDSEQKGNYGGYGDYKDKVIAYDREHNGDYGYQEKNVSYDHKGKDGYDYQEKDVRKGSGYNSIGKDGYGEYDREKRGGYSGNEKGVYHHKEKNKGGDYGVGELVGVPMPAHKEKGGHKLKDIDYEEDGQRRKKEPQTYEEYNPNYEDQDPKKADPKKKYGGDGKHEHLKDRVVPAAAKPPIKHFEVTIARHKSEKRQYEHKPRKCTKTGRPKPTDGQKHEQTREPTIPGQCLGGCGGPDPTSTMTTTVMTTIMPSVTKPITHRLTASSNSITPISTTTLAQTEMGSATSSVATGTSTASPMPTFIAGAARLGSGVQVAGGWGILVACMWVGMVAIGFGMGGVGF